MAAFANCECRYFEGTDADVLEVQIATYILTLDSTTHPIISIFALYTGVMVVSGA
jgi:hypothetical protein